MYIYMYMLMDRIVIFVRCGKLKLLRLLVVFALCVTFLAFRDSNSGGEVSGG
jgi:hypothetical protein